jgi:hypothetical protein
MQAKTVPAAMMRQRENITFSANNRVNPILGTQVTINADSRLFAFFSITATARFDCFFAEKPADLGGKNEF